MDRFDWVAVAGIALIVVAAARLEGVLVATLFAGLLLSLAVRRAYDGRPWEALGWTAWVVAAVAVVVDLGGIAFAVTFFGSLLLGLGLLIGDRVGLLPAVWTVEGNESGP